jgi:Protein of unknown function (DUF3574)
MKIKPRFIALGILFALGLVASIVFVVLTVPAQQAIVAHMNMQQFCESQRYDNSFAQTELLFGLSKPGNTVITEAEFQTFIDQEVTPLFPDGLTLLSGTGQFRNDQQVVVKEGAKLLLLLYPASYENSKDIEQIRQAYKTRFQQESVLRVDDQTCVSF